MCPASTVTEVMLQDVGDIPDMVTARHLALGLFLDDLLSKLDDSWAIHTFTNVFISAP